ncbi:MAG: hypothetical protein A2189_01775 [Paenibacillus sp. RIFOXYA1_FULL_44_5]|nr:MAG: hypothetical protein A2189_01775 [Paenibacillus sp. RIFOXYA1_FULL_44_5]
MKFSIKHSTRWSIFISVFTFFLASIFSVAATSVLEGISWGLGVVVVLIIISVGIAADIMGLASAAAKELPFHAMASEKVKGSKHAIKIVRNADRFASFFNDVVGDVSGIISGAAGALVVLKLVSNTHAETAVIQTVVSVVFSGLVSALTVGGKAMGKSFAIHYATEIVLFMGKILFMMEHRLGIRIFNSKKTKTKGKRGNKRAARPSK